jgi:hypothetical protein
MVIDLTEIEDDHAFENFCMHLLQDMGLNIPVPPAIGADGGRDIVCEEPSQFATRGYRWLVSCKHFAGSGNSVGVNRDWAKPHKLTEHGCNGFMFMFSTGFTEDFRSSVDKICHQIRGQYRIFNHLDIERILLSSPKFFPLIRQYFPLSHARLASLSNADDCCQYVTPEDALYAIYTRTGAHGEISYQVMGNCCIQNYLDHLEKERIEYGVTQIRSENRW